MSHFCGQLYYNKQFNDRVSHALSIEQVFMQKVLKNNFILDTLILHCELVAKPSALGPVYTYPDSFVSADDLLRFRPSTCIQIRSEFDTRMFESLIEHALMNKLRRHHDNAPRGWAISALLRHRFPKFAVTGVHT